MLHVTIPHIHLIYCDDFNAKDLAQNLVFHACIKHIEIDHHFLCVLVLNNQLDIQYICSNDQLVDLLTKCSPMPSICCSSYQTYGVTTHPFVERCGDESINNIHIAYKEVHIKLVWCECIV